MEQVDLGLIITLLSGETQEVNVSDDAPAYSVFGDDNAGDFADAVLPLGVYNLAGDALANGAVFTSAAVSFSVIGPRIGSYTLINADTEQPIDGFDPIAEGAVIDMSTLGTGNINIRANPVDFLAPAIESTLLNLEGPTGTIQNRVESYRPYAVFGDPTNMDLNDDDPVLNYNNWAAVQNGSFSLLGQPYGENGGVGEVYGSLTLNFSITNAAALADTGEEDQLALLPNYPNPFNPATSIRFNLPADAPVKLEVYDMLGRVVKVLVDGNLSSGNHEINFEARDLSSGMYLYRLETPDAVKTRLMTLLK